MPTAHTRRGAIAYDATRIAPSLPTLLYIHGAGMERITFGGHLMRPPNYNAIRLDLPNHGDSEFVGLSRYDDLLAYSTDVLAFMDALAINQAVICGHSMGGGVALLMALHHPERIPAAIVINGSAKMRLHPRMLAALPGEVYRSAENMLLATFPILDRSDLVPLSAADPDNEEGYLQFLRINPLVMLRDYWLCHTFNLNAQLTDIRAPVLVVSGGQDKIFPPRQIALMEDALPAATYTEFPGCGHFTPAEVPDKLTATIADWLTTHRLAPSARPSTPSHCTNARPRLY